MPSDRFVSDDNQQERSMNNQDNNVTLSNSSAAKICCLFGSLLAFGGTATLLCLESNIGLVLAALGGITVGGSALKSCQTDSDNNSVESTPTPIPPMFVAESHAHNRQPDAKAPILAIHPNGEKAIGLPISPRMN